MTTAVHGSDTQSYPSLISLAASALLFYLVLAAPNHPEALAWDILLVFPLELPVILGALAVMGVTGRGAILIRGVIVISLTLLTLTKFADFAMFSAYNRGFNPLVDLHLIPAAWNLGSGAIGTARALGAVIGALSLLSALALALWWAAMRWSKIELPQAPRRLTAIALVPALLLAVAEIGDAMRKWQLPFDVPGAAFTARVAVERAEMLGQTARRLSDFKEAASTDPFADATPLLDEIGTRDVLFLYVESYGASSLTNPRYAPLHLDTLDAIAAELAARGLSMRSGWLEAPMIGGQSWLTHTTLATGLWSPDQRTYGAALVSGRKSLFHLASENAFETVAVMPAITMDWPEAGFMGFDRVLAAADLGYEGRPFNWVTMPDQFTLAALDRLVLPGAPGVDRPPVFAQVALISSHAPWTPVPRLVAWEDVGDGRVFNAMAAEGDAPDVVWRDRNRVRAQFGKAVDYSLRTAGSYMARLAEAEPLIVLLGDHQPAAFVSEDDSFNVPVHVIGPAHLVERFASWGWVDGMRPSPATQAIRMDDFRNRFLRAFSSLSP
ncbi:MAG: sulfatase [Pseudomonadota bacterium]